MNGDDDEVFIYEKLEKIMIETKQQSMCNKVRPIIS